MSAAHVVRVRRWFSVPLAVLLAAGVAPDGVAHGQQAPTASPSPPVTLTLRVAGGRRQFRPGETIAIELTFDSPIRERYLVDGALYDRSGRLESDEFRIDPLDPVSDPLLDYFAATTGGLGGGLRSTGVLGDKPFTVSLDLNEWFRLEVPGTYRVSARSNRVTDETNRAPMDRLVVPVESTIATVEILPRDAAWEAAEIARAVAALNTPDPSGSAAAKACRALRFLATPDAVVEIVKRFDDRRCQWDFRAGLFTAADRKQVVSLMETGLRSPDQPITADYLWTLAVLSVYVEHPELRAPQGPETKGRLVLAGPISGRSDLVEQAQARYADVLEAALSAKTGVARAISLAELDALRARTATSAGSAVLQRQMIARFVDLPVDRQTRLLEFEWPRVAHADMTPVLRSLADRPGRLADLALRRLYELDPDEGRARILRRIDRLERDASLETLGLLPDAELPQFDGTLAARLEASLNELDLGLLFRYASASVAPRMLALLGPRVGSMACRPQSYTLAYFLRAAPGDGATLLGRALGSRTLTGCYASVLSDTGILLRSPVIEAAALTHLDDAHPRVVLSAIQTLERIGSAAAVAALRAAFERWSSAWRGRQDELRYNRLTPGDQPGALHGMIEQAYMQALTAAPGRPITADDAAALRGLCVTDGCRSRIDTLGF